MDNFRFIGLWITARNVLGKKLITDEYINYNANALNVRFWDEDVVDRIFSQIMQEDPYKADISAQSIRTAYYKLSSPAQIGCGECKHDLCDGSGYVGVEKLVDGKWYEYFCRCSCDAGRAIKPSRKFNGMDYTIKDWSISLEGYRLRFDLREMKNGGMPVGRNLNLLSAIKEI